LSPRSLKQTGSEPLFYVGVQLESQDAVVAGVGNIEGAAVGVRIVGDLVGMRQLAGPAARRLPPAMEE